MNFATVVLLLSLVVPFVPSAPMNGFVVDETGLLTATDVAQINDDIKALSDSGAGQIGVLLTNDLRGKTRAELAVDVFKAWGIGYGDRGATGKGRGVLILLKPAFPDRGVKIEVGRDLEGRLNDGKVGELLRQAIPYFRESRYAQGLRYLIFALGPEMRVEQAEVDAPILPAKSADNGGILLPILAALIVAGALVWVFVAFRRRRKRDIEELASPPSMHWRPVTVDRRTGAIEPVTAVNAPIVVINEEAPRQRRGWSVNDDASAPSYTPSPSYESPSPSPSYESSSTSSFSSSFDSGSSFGGGGDSGGAGADSSF
jgi:uncharacterized membrane protein YgcG